MTEVTQILSLIERGDPRAADQLLPLVYDELKRLAACKMADERTEHTLQATALVHEAYIRLVDQQQAQRWNSRGHFYSAAAEAMRRILVEKARRRERQKHGGGWKRVAPERLNEIAKSPSEDLIALDEALQLLAAEDAEACEMVKLRYFAGLTIEQAADALGISVRTANRTWAYAKAWLFERLNP